MIANPIGHNMKRGKSKNNSLILREILRTGPISRKDLAQRLGLTAATITNLTAEFVERKVLYEVGSIDSTRAGRRSIALDIRDDYAYAVGVHVAAGSVSVGVVNLKGDLVMRCQLPPEVLGSAEALVDSVNMGIEETLKSFPRRQIIGIGIAAHGLVSPTNGTLLVSSNDALTNVEISTLIHDQFELPVFLDNNVRCMALGENLFGVGRQIRDFIYVIVGRGIGAGVILNGELYGANSSISGEFGHIAYQTHGGLPCWCGNTGCLECYASEAALLRELNLASTVDLVHMALAGNNEVREKIAIAGEQIGISLASLLNVIPIHQVVVSGYLVQQPDLPLMHNLRKAVESRSLISRMQPIQIKTGTLNMETGIIGGASLPILNFFDHPDDLFTF